MVSHEVEDVAQGLFVARWLSHPPLLPTNSGRGDDAALLLLAESKSGRRDIDHALRSLSLLEVFAC